MMKNEIGCIKACPKTFIGENAHECYWKNGKVFSFGNDFPFSKSIQLPK